MVGWDKWGAYHLFGVEWKLYSLVRMWSGKLVGFIFVYWLWLCMPVKCGAITKKICCTRTLFFSSSLHSILHVLILFLSLNLLLVILSLVALFYVCRALGKILTGIRVVSSLTHVHVYTFSLNFVALLLCQHRAFASSSSPYSEKQTSRAAAMKIESKTRERMKMVMTMKKETHIRSCKKSFPQEEEREIDR